MRSRAAANAESELRLLLVGPCPPPRGGISVHVETARRLLRAEGVVCRAIDSGGHRARGGPLRAAASVARLLLRVRGHARRGFTVHTHTNGHSTASWALAWGCAVAAGRAHGRVLTLHSGMLPAFLERTGAGGRWLHRRALARYEAVVCVNRAIHDALLAHGAPAERLSIFPAHLGTLPLERALPAGVESWMAGRTPLLCAALFFRPEYGFDLLLDAIGSLRGRHPDLGCVVLGGGDDEARARRRTAELGLERQVLLAGDVPHEECLAVMARADVYLRPSLADGDAISVREALALGVPVVASDAGNRPPGTILHRAGDAADLAAQIEAVLSAAAGARAARPPTASVPAAGGSAADRAAPEDGAPAPERAPHRRSDGSAQSSLETLLWIERRARAAGADRSATRSGRLLARLARLAGMSAPELVDRSRQTLARRSDRVAAHARRETSDRALLSSLGAVPALHSTVEASLLRHLEDRVAPRFYPSAGRAHRRAMAELLWHLSPGWLSAAATEAERLCAHRIEILGCGEIDLGPEIDWHRDPLSGAVWERRHYSLWDPLREPVDVKRVYELNRHQHLPRLGKAYHLLGEERYAREVVAQISSWIEQNPRGVGIHWHSSLELAIRALSWMWALVFVLPSPALDERTARRICRSLAEQLDHVARHLSVWSSPNTHLIGEAAALYVAGLLFQDGARGRRWLALGARHLEREAERQVLADGLHAELSPYYHCYTIDFYLQALVLGRRSVRPLGRGVWQRVESLLGALAELVRPDGSLPLLGDDDGGRALALGAGSYADPRDLLCAGAILFERGEWKRRPTELREEAVWLLGREGYLGWEAIASRPLGRSRTDFRAGGYLVERGGGARSHLVFDRGDLGRLGGGHGHADALSLVLWAHGEELLVDSGTCVYNAEPEWREFFRSTRAHNTVVIDGADQSRQGDTFRWSRQARTRNAVGGSHPGIDWAAAEHDGYAPSAGGVVHRRRLLRVDAGYWLVLDDFRAAATGRSRERHRRRATRVPRHRFDVLWHFAPEARVEVETAQTGGEPTMLAATATHGGAGLTLRVHACARLTGSVVRGASSPPQGWVSRRYGERRAAPVLEARFSARAPAACVTLLAPWPAGPRRSAGVRALPVEVCGGASSSAVALAVQHNRGEDLVVLAGADTQVEVGSCRARAEVLWLRVEEERLVRCLALGATEVEVGGTRVVESPLPADHFWSAPCGARVAAPDVVEEADHVRHRRDR